MSLHKSASLYKTSFSFLSKFFGNNHSAWQSFQLDFLHPTNTNTLHMVMQLSNAHILELLTCIVRTVEKNRMPTSFSHAHSPKKIFFQSTFAVYMCVRSNNALDEFGA